MSLIEIDLTRYTGIPPSAAPSAWEPGEEVLSGPEPRLQAVRTGVERMNLNPQPGEPDPCPEQGYGHDSRQCLTCSSRIEWVRGRLRDQSVLGVESETAPFEFADIAAILDGGLEEVDADGGACRIDGARFLYRGATNGFVGDPESFKTGISVAVGAYVLGEGGYFVFVDTDHNGPEFLLKLLTALGVSRKVLIERFRYAQPDSGEALVAAVAAGVSLAREARAGDHDSVEVLTVLDSVGENLGLFGVSPNDDQGFLDMNRQTAVQLALAGCTVVTVDHLAKGSESRKYGATGSTAKKRAADGAVYRVQVVRGRDYSPITGGASDLLLVKDRRGGVRSLGVKTGDIAARFELDPPDEAGIQRWQFLPDNTRPSAEIVNTLKLIGDVQLLNQLDPSPRSRDDVRARMQWGTARAGAALSAWREQRDGRDDD